MKEKMTSPNEEEREIRTSETESTDLSLPSIRSSPYLVDHHTGLEESAPAPTLSNTSGVSLEEVTCVVGDRAAQEAVPLSIELDSTGPHNKRIASESVQERKDPKNIGFYPVCKAWVFEIVSIILGILMFLAITVAFTQLNGKSLPNWPLAITLNTLVAFLTISSKAALTVPVSVAISQAQWNWFQQERPLYDFHIFDQASRGAWGSLVFLKRIHFKHFASIGAFLMVVSLFTSPITQLAISYPIRSIVVEGIANVGTVPLIFFTRESFHLSVMRALVLSTALDTDQFSTPIEPKGASCSTGNCTFDTYASLGVCLKTANISSQLHIEQLQDDEPTGIGLYDAWPKFPVIFPGAGEVWKASIPGGPVLVSQTGFASVLAMLNRSESIGFPISGDLMQTKILSLVLISTKPIIPSNLFENGTQPNMDMILKATNGFQFEALELFFHLCIQTYNTTVRMGKETTQVEQSASQPLSKEPGAFLDLVCSSLVIEQGRDCRVNKSRYNETMYLKAPFINSHGTNSSMDNKQFGIDYQSIETMGEDMAVSLQGYTGRYYNPQADHSGTINLGKEFQYHIYTDALFSKESLGNKSERDNRVLNVFTNVATVLSSMIRDPNSGFASEHVSNFTGQNWKDESYVHINWGWISFLAAENALAAGFVVLTMISQSRRQRTHQRENVLVYEDVKDSSLATLVALGGQCRQRMGGGLRPIDELEKAAKDLRVRLDTQEVVPAESS
ncbi:unnamed protein product [Clonostachys rosea f. rosea IK726]|uniref:Uncharacterized protein n=1 Tax=Clonostachys rosea f. rosea IK726 TaxID=1349383 RepID=A0ACA9TJ93_BIOOC|nr:unnamed protein product [Clonostachys rosea f. rosea IK726]